MAKKLSPKQERFCQEYMKDLNGTQAAIRTGYSKKTAHPQAGRLLSKVIIKKRIDALKKKLAEKADVNAGMVIEEFKKLAFANVQDYITYGNEIKDISRIDAVKAAAVESIQSNIRHDGGQSEGYTEKVKLKFHSKIAALENLGRYLGIYAADNKQLANNTKLFQCFGMKPVGDHESDT